MARAGFLNRAHMRAAVLSPEGVRVSNPSLSAATSLSLCNCIHSCIPEIKSSGSHFKVEAVLKGQNRSASVAAMVDCGATALFINRKFVERHKIRTHPLSSEIPLYNIDGSKNRAGEISCAAHLQLTIGESEEWREFLVTDLGPEDVILGLPWLRSVNPKIDWAGGTMRVDAKTEDPGDRNRGEVEQIAANRA